MNDIEKFVRLSKYAGQRFDLVQAGGGNTSVKSGDGTMLIKASGVSLAEVSLKKGYVVLSIQKIQSILKESLHSVLANDQKKRELWISEKLSTVIDNQSLRPSIELFMHILLQKYVLHVHPIAVAMIVCKKNWNKILETLFPDALCIEYKTPGIDLALVLQEKIDHLQKNGDTIPEIIFLQNHGIIIHADDIEKIFFILEAVLLKIEHFLDIDFDTYKIPTKIMNIINSCVMQHDVIAYVSQDQWLRQEIITRRKLLFSFPCFPDAVVYCGACPVEMKTIKDVEPILQYMQKYNVFPRVIIYENEIVFLAQSIRKAIECEAVFKAHLIIMKNLKSSENTLSQQELLYLMNMEAERYRQTC